MGRRRRSRVPLLWAVVTLSGLAVAAACGFDGAGTAAGPGSGAGTGPNGGGGSASDGGGLTSAEGGDIVLDPDSGTVDAGSDGPFQCPTACSSCTGTTCNIDCPGPRCTTSTISCPAGVPCRVRCSMQGACSDKVIACPSTTSCEVKCTSAEACVRPVVQCGAGACRVECSNAEQACVGIKINAASASSVCMQCRGSSGNPGCVGPDVTPPAAPSPCGKSCNGGGCSNLGNGFSGCADVASCPAP